MNLLCKIFGHSPYPEYHLKTSTRLTCSRVTYCRICRAILDSEHTEHVWVKRPTANPCEWIEQCRNCGYQSDLKSDHDYSVQNGIPGTCKVETTCSKCGRSRGLSTEHQLGGETELEGCTEYKVCLRCGWRDAGTPRHAYSEPRQIGCKTVRVCLRCGDQWTLEAHHEFQEISRKELNQRSIHYEANLVTYQCTLCGEQVEKEEDGHYTDW